MGLCLGAAKLGKRSPDPSRVKLGCVTIHRVFALFVKVILGGHVSVPSGDLLTSITPAVASYDVS